MSFWKSEQTTVTNDTVASETKEYKRVLFPKKGDILDGLYDITMLSSKSGKPFVFRGEFKDGKPLKGRLTYSSGNACEGTFDKDYKFVSGVYKYDNIIYEGKFSNGQLNDDNGKVTYESGIVFEGKVVNDRPQFGKGKFTVPSGIEATFEDVSVVHTGTLSQEGDRFVITFKDAPYISISSDRYSCINNCIISGYIEVVYPDGSKISFDRSYKKHSLDGDFREFTVSKKHNFLKWGKEQLCDWIHGSKEFNHFPKDFKINLLKNNVTPAHIFEFTDDMFKNYGLNDDVHILQFKQQLHNMKTTSY